LYDSEDFQEIVEQTFDPYFRGAVLIHDLTLVILETKYKSGLPSLKFLKHNELGVFVGFPHKRLSFLTERIDEMIGRLHNAGLINLWYERVFNFRKQPAEEPDPTPLTLEHLSIGFLVSRNFSFTRSYYE